MSAFCVYGFTRQLALARAKRSVKDYDKKLERLLTQEEWEARVAEEAARLFEKAKRTKVSNTYDAPEFAASFIELGERSGDLRGGEVWARMETKKKAKKTGKPILKWQPWKGEAA